MLTNKNNDKYIVLKDDTIEYFGIKLYRIKAIKSFSNVKVGDLGGYIEKEANLSHYGNAWAFDDALVFGNAEISDDVVISGNAKIWGDVVISGNALIYGNAEVYGNAKIWGDAVIININQWFCIENVGSRKDIIRFYKNDLHILKTHVSKICS